ncbi:MAG: hypothetical protein ABTB30_11060 [Clostridia bacterium]
MQDLETAISQSGFICNIRRRKIEVSMTSSLSFGCALISLFAPLLISFRSFFAASLYGQPLFPLNLTTFSSTWLTILP